MAVVNPFDFFVEPYAETFPFALYRRPASELAPIWRRAAQAPLFDAYLTDVAARSRAAPSISWSSSTQRLQKRVRYVIRMEPGVQTPEETLALAAGSCRDSAWLLVQIAAPSGPRRAFRLRLPDPAEARRQSARRPREAESDFTDLHAWAEVYLPGAGWIGLDADLGPAARRGPHPARRHAALSLGRADHRQRRALPRSSSPSR